MHYRKDYETNNQIKLDVAELKSLLEQAKRKRVQDFLSLEIRKLETELISIQDSLKKITIAESKPSNTSDSKRYQVKLNGYGWDQSDKYVKIFVTLKDVQNLSKENVYCKLTEKSMELHVDNLDNKDYILIINKLLENINVEASHWKQKTDMVVVFLAKSRPGVQWSHMTELEKKADEGKANKFKTDGLDKKDPQDSIMGLMKNMYETGDDNMKRMIAKAWTEGQDKRGGSSLSPELPDF